MNIEIEKGVSIYRAIELAIVNARQHAEDTHFMFNDIFLTARKDSCIMDIAAIYSLKSQLRRLGVSVNG